MELKNFNITLTPEMLVILDEHRQFLLNMLDENNEKIITIKVYKKNESSPNIE